VEVVALGETVVAGVVGHPAGEHRCLSDGREEGFADRLRVGAVEEGSHVVAEILDHGLAGVASAEPVVQGGEGVRRGLHHGDIGQPNPGAGRALCRGSLVLGRYEPA
jgi:hypothetical protein